MLRDNDSLDRKFRPTSPAPCRAAFHPPRSTDGAAIARPAVRVNSRTIDQQKIAPLQRTRALSRRDEPRRGEADNDYYPSALAIALPRRIFFRPIVLPIVRVRYRLSTI